MSLYEDLVALRAKARDSCALLHALMASDELEAIDDQFKILSGQMMEIHLLQDRFESKKREARARQFAKLGHATPRSAGNRVEHLESHRVGRSTGFMDNGTMGVVYDDNGERALDVTPAFRLISEK
jgi:hypothetical protein